MYGIGCALRQTLKRDKHLSYFTPCDKTHEHRAKTTRRGRGRGPTAHLHVGDGSWRRVPPTSPFGELWTPVSSTTSRLPPLPPRTPTPRGPTGGHGARAAAVAVRRAQTRRVVRVGAFRDGADDVSETRGGWAGWTYTDTLGC